MTRTSLYLPDTLHQRLMIAAKREGEPLSRLVRHLLNQALAKQEAGKLKQMYTTLKELDGIGGAEITDASTTIDEVLYGEHGAWKGRDE
jgi:hypothetical protein